MFPDAQKLDAIPISQPVQNQVIRSLGILVPCNIRQADIILIVLPLHGDLFAQHVDFGHGSSLDSTDFVPRFS